MLNTPKSGLSSLLEKCGVTPPGYPGVDPIALSVAGHRLRKYGDSRAGMLPNPTPDVLEPSDIVAANSIRDYYTKKIVVWNLKGVKLSPFRSDLVKVLATDLYGKGIPVEYSGLIYKLPEFYEFDTRLDLLYDTFWPDLAGKKLSKINNLVLEPVDFLVQGVRGLKFMVCLFNARVDGNNVPVKIKLRYDSHLKAPVDLATKVFKGCKKVRVSGRYLWVDGGDYPTYLLREWKIEDIVEVVHAG